MKITDADGDTIEVRLDPRGPLVAIQDSEAYAVVYLTHDQATELVQALTGEDLRAQRDEARRLATECRADLFGWVGGTPESDRPFPWEVTT